MTTAVQVDPYTVEQQQGLTPQEEAAVAALALFLASVIAVKAITLPSVLVGRLMSLGLPRRAVMAAGKLTLEPALTGRTRWGSPTAADVSQPTPFNPTPGFPAATPGAPSFGPSGPASLNPVSVRPLAVGSASERARAAITAGRPIRRFGPPTMVKRVAVNEPIMRARYLLAAAKRLAKAAAEGRFTAALRREQAYLAAHRRAGLRRAAVARAYDEVARGQTFLKWVAVMDQKTTPDCAAKNGSVWNVSNPPFPPPGAVHPHCRCHAAPLATPRSAAALVAVAA